MNSQSIHPRVVNGRTQFPKVYTCRAKNPETLRRKIAAISKHVERHPLDMAADGYMRKLKERA